MKTIFNLLLILFSAIGGVQAKQEISRKNNALVISEVTEVMRVPDVPKGLSVEIAYKLIKGEIKEVVIEDKKGLVTFYLSSASIKSKITYSDKVVAYRDAWVVNGTPSRFKEKSDYMGTGLLWITILLIVAISVVNSMSGVDWWKLLAFYIVVLLATVPVGLFVGGGAAFISGTIATTLMGSLAGRFQGAILGIIAGLFMGMIVGISAHMQDYDMVWQYAKFFAIVMAISFVIAQIVRFSKKKWVLAT